ncbi:MAG: restriction endonuclease subunit S, partial [Chitinophagales bacterium]
YSRIKTGLIQDLLTKGIDKNGNIRTEQTHEFKDSPLGRIPKEWESLTIEQVKNFITSGSRGWAKYYSIEGSKFIRITNLKRNQIEIDLSDLKYVKLPVSIEGIRSKLMEGDLLISITADLGIIGVVSSTLDDAFVNQHISLVRLNSSIVVPKFIGYFLSSSYGQAMFNLLNDGGAKAGLNLKTINNIFVLKPKIEEQEMIVKKIEKVNEVILKFKEELSKL